ncbi:hypothetical protein [Acidovorax sp. sic0104]|uniref:hypothetical protein n=1 Tax=Acidovorax sp. sic0104 TaxID=2854784 RepID=UPI001C494053|nr:hypothetical protein [Acidovorax sp. sic0104]MBV7541035.1 hypothetical protein [Acidovorax sp. sic0104]
MADTNTTKVDEAEKEIGNVLAELEDETDSEVQKIALEDMVEVDPATGKPALHKGVDVTVTPRPKRQWIR